MNCPHCHKPIETKKSLRKRIEALEAELTQLRLQKITGPNLPPIWITPTPPQPEPYFPTWPYQSWTGDTIGTIDPFGLTPTVCRAQN